MNRRPAVQQLFGLLLLLLLMITGRAQLQQAPWDTRPLSQIAFLYHSTHRGAGCKSSTHSYTLEPAPINACYPADAMSSQPHKYECTDPGGMSNYQYALHRNIYSKTDKFCTTTPLAKQFVKKDTKCKKDPDSGAYLLATCSTIESHLMETGQVLVKAYTDSKCTSGRSIYGTGTVKATLFNRCMPVYNPPSVAEKDDVAYYRKLNLLPGQLRTSSFSVEERKYSVTDVRCKGKPTDTVVHSYDMASSTCKADPLQAEQFYTYATAVPDQAAMVSLVPQYWMLYA
jgi:hypothetical protein